jgi:hypothetical protein
MPACDAPNIKEKPKRVKRKPESPKSVTFFNATLMLFFVRVSPDSRQRNPACMANTKAAAVKIH